MNAKYTRMVDELIELDLDDEDARFCMFLGVNAELTPKKEKQLIQIYERYIGYGIEG